MGLEHHILLIVRTRLSSLCVNMYSFLYPSCFCTGRQSHGSSEILSSLALLRNRLLYMRNDLYWVSLETTEHLSCPTFPSLQFLE